MKKVDLVEMIKVIVADEVRKQLPNVVSEMYLKRLIEDSGNSKRVNGEVKSSRTFAQIFEDEINSLKDEQIPEPMENSDEGIYQQSQAIHNESKRSKLLSPDNPLAAMYEGVKPIDQSTGVQKSIDTNIFGNPKQYGEFFKKMNEVAKPAAPMQQTDNTKMRELEQRRKALDELKVDVKS